VELLRQALVFLHLLGMATLIGAFLLQRRASADGSLNSAWLHAGALQLVTGLGLVGIAEVGTDPVNQGKTAVKLAVLLVILALVLIYRRRSGRPAWVVPALGGLTVLNVAVAVFWS